MRITMRMWGMKIQNATWCELFGRSRVTWAIRNWLAFNQQKTIQLCSQVPSPVTIFRDAFHDMNPHACCSNLYFWFTKKYLASSVPSCPIISPSGLQPSHWPWGTAQTLPLRGVLGGSVYARSLRKQVISCSKDDGSVIIFGEPGTKKERGAGLMAAVSSPWIPSGNLT